jgi:hypothetical protein
MGTVKIDYIDKALNDLIPALGVKEYVDQEKLTTLIESKKIKEAIKAIAFYLGLPIEVNIYYVPNGYRPNSNYGSGFQSKNLVETDQFNRGTQSITAQVSMPQDLPFYGTPKMVNFPINVRLSENSAENPATLIGVMAHELSHVVLCSIWHKEKENEFYTDLTAMILGFAEIIRVGRKVVKTTTNQQGTNTITHTETTTFGYLSDENFNFAYEKIEKFLSKPRSLRDGLLNELRLSQEKLREFRTIFLVFGQHLESLDKNPDHKYSPSDGHKILAIHYPDYIYKIKSFIEEYEIRLEEIKKNIKSINHYTEQNIEIMKQLKIQLKSNDEELTKHLSSLQSDDRILRKYQSIFYKLKLKV